MIRLLKLGLSLMVAMAALALCGCLPMHTGYGVGYYSGRNYYESRHSAYRHHEHHAEYEYAGTGHHGYGGYSWFGNGGCR